MSRKALTLTVPVPALATALARVLHAAATDDARPILRAIVLDVIAKRGKEPTVRLTACDNYRIAWAEIGHDVAAPRGFPRLQLRRDHAEAVLKACKAAKQGRVAIAVDRPITDLALGEVSITVGGLTAVYPLVEGTYPNFEQVIHDTVPPRAKPHTIAFTGEYLAQVAAAFTSKPGKSRVSEPSDATLVLEWWDPLKPTRITTRGESDHGEILMPVRITT